MLERTLKSYGGEKDKQSRRYLNYSHHELITEMESKFLEGMSWDNYGDWHIDHIYPIYRHVEDGVTDPSIINALTNLIPMWSNHNRSKSSQTLEEFLNNNPELTCLYSRFLEVGIDK